MCIPHHSCPSRHFVIPCRSHYPFLFSDLPVTCPFSCRRVQRSWETYIAVKSIFEDDVIGQFHYASRRRLKNFRMAAATAGGQLRTIITRAARIKALMPPMSITFCQFWPFGMFCVSWVWRSPWRIWWQQGFGSRWRRVTSASEND